MPVDGGEHLPRELIGGRRRLPACQQIERDEANLVGVQFRAELAPVRVGQAREAANLFDKQYVAGLRVCNAPEQLGPSQFCATFVFDIGPDNRESALGGERVESNCCGRGVWPSRSAMSRGRRKNGCVGAIASLPGWENRPPWSQLRSRENWRALSGRSPNTLKPAAFDALRSTADTSGKEVNLHHISSKAEQGWRRGHGQENPRHH